MQPRDAEIAHRRIPLDVHRGGALAAPLGAIIGAFVGSPTKKMRLKRGERKQGRSYLLGSCVRQPTEEGHDLTVYLRPGGKGPVPHCMSLFALPLSSCVSQPRKKAVTWPSVSSQTTKDRFRIAFPLRFAGRRKTALFDQFLPEPDAMLEIDLENTNCRTAGRRQAHQHRPIPSEMPRPFVTAGIE